MAFKILPAFPGHVSSIRRLTSAVLGQLRTAVASLPLPGTLMVVGPPTIKQRFVRDLGGITFTPVDLSRLESMKAAADAVFGEFGLEVEDIAQHTFVPQTRPPGEISSLNGEIAPRLLAGNAIGAIAVALAGAETGTADNYKAVKNRTDGIGATTAAAAEGIIGQFLLQRGRYGVMVATEGTASHPKPDEPAIGNPTIPRGKTFPGVRDLKRRGGAIEIINGIPVVAELRPVKKGKDVIEGTELASTSPGAFRLIAGKPKDNGACTVSFEADEWPVTADTYADKVAISPEVVRAINSRGENLVIDVGADIADTLRAISRASGIPLRELGVIGLGLKPRYKIKNGQSVEGSLKNAREGRREMLASIEALGCRLCTIDDGETPAMRTLVVGNPIKFDRGGEGKVHVFIGPGGVFESMTLVRAIRDAGGDGWWAYVNKNATKRTTTYAQRTQLEEKELAELDAIGVKDPSSPRNIFEDVPDNGDRLLIVTTFMPNPLNPQAIPVEVDEKAGTITFYQEVFSSDGSVRGLLWRLKARRGISHVKSVLSPVIPDLMAMEDTAQMHARLDKIAETSEGLAAIRSGLLSYLYYYVEENPGDGPDFILNEGRLRARALETKERRDFAVLLWATKNHPNWFTNPETVAQALTETGA